MSKYVLAIDQGTTGTTVSLIQHDGSFLASANQDFAQIYPKPGWVEHDPETIWSTVIHCIHEVLKSSAVDPTAIVSIGITNQRETVVVWDRKTTEPLYNAIVWQCRRTTEYCEKLKKKGLEKKVYKKTGLVLDPYFSGSKIHWILNHNSSNKSRAKKGELACGTIDSYLLWRLSQGMSHKTDVSNASRTMLMDISTGEWDDELLKIFDVHASMLPEISDSSGILGLTRNVPGLPDGIPIAGIAGDQQAALFGQACFKQGEAKCTFGTGSFLLLNTGAKVVYSKSGLLSTVAWRLKGQSKITYALEGGAFICGAAVQWLRDEMGFIKDSSEVEALAAQVEDSGGVEFVPALTGLGAPHWKPQARGLLCGLTRGTNRSHIARACLEAMALQNVDILEAMQKDLGKNLGDIKVDGGATANDLLMQLQADYLCQKIYRPKNIESTTMGAAYLAGLGVGFWNDISEINKIWKLDKSYTPRIKKVEKQDRMKRWHKAIERAIL